LTTLPDVGLAGGTSQQFVIVETGVSGDFVVVYDSALADTRGLRIGILSDPHSPNFAISDSTQNYPPHTRLETQIVRLEGLIDDVTNRVTELEQSIEAIKAAQADEIIVLREVSHNEARREILDALEAGEPLDQADLAEGLSLELSLVVDVCNELVAEGVVNFYDDDRS